MQTKNAPLLFSYKYDEIIDSGHQHKLKHKLNQNYTKNKTKNKTRSKPSIWLDRICSVCEFVAKLLHK